MKIYLLFMVLLLQSCKSIFVITLGDIVGLSVLCFIIIGFSIYFLIQWIKNLFK